MAQIDIDGDTLVVNVEGLDKLWALKSRLAIPLANVRGATRTQASSTTQKAYADRAPTCPA